MRARADAPKAPRRCVPRKPRSTTAKLNLEWTVVRAPISGRVGRAAITAGNLVQAGPPSATLLTTIVSLDPIYVYFDSDEQRVPEVRAARCARARGSSCRSYSRPDDETGFPHEGKLDFVDNRARPGAGTIRVRALVQNPNQPIRAGPVRSRAARGRRATSRGHADAGPGDRHRSGPQVRARSSNPTAASSIGLCRSAELVDGLRVVNSGLNARRKRRHQRTAARPAGHEGAGQAGDDGRDSATLAAIADVIPSAADSESRIRWPQ